MKKARYGVLMYWYCVVSYGDESKLKNSAHVRTNNSCPTFDRCVLGPSFCPQTDQYQYGLFTATRPMILFHPQLLTGPSASFHAAIAFGRFVQRTSSTLKSHNIALHLDRSRSIHFTQPCMMHGRHLRCVRWYH
jgi:hypothetical protein